MSENLPAASQKLLPSMATTSLRAVLDTYLAKHDDGGIKGYDCLITKVNAIGSTKDEKSPDVEDDELGIKGWHARSGPQFRINYEIEFDDDGVPVNPLNRDRVDSVIHHMDRLGIDDASVSRARVLFWDEELGETTETGRAQWHMNLESGFVDAEQDRKEVKKHPENMALIEQEGFKYRVLNCRRLIDRQQELNEPRTKQRPAIEWNGDTFDGLRNDINHHTRRINTEHMGKYGFLKRYGPDEEDSIILLGVESGADEGVEA